MEGVEDEGSGDSQQDVLASVNIATESIKLQCPRDCICGHVLKLHIILLLCTPIIHCKTQPCKESPDPLSSFSSAPPNFTTDL